MRNEEFGFLRIIALVLLLLALLFTNLDKLLSADKMTKDYGKWLLCILLTFVCNGISSILQKEHQMAFPSKYNREFMFFATAVCCVVYVAIALKKVKIKDLGLMKGKRFGAISGVFNALANFFTLMLASRESASALFPMISAGTVISALVCGRLVFKEKLRINHFIAIAFGIASVILMKL